jgi:hypothetical protein
MFVDFYIRIHKSLLLKCVEDSALFFFCYKTVINKVIYFQNGFETIRIYLKETWSFSQKANLNSIRYYLLKAGHSSRAV